ncbi:aldo/keto reductase [Alkalicoccus urumqiensis]|uniref:Aldo/keto reductase n=1 Tax=Alkalicoccus urumqiensis TaxID=1548213 RepID=A0A2P6MFI8_ALKUR|nr:aldo/keto reductase [Alkalicoccus urumqiensis]PRO65056.1 aldo/keto reductase [Alkalicoccus urumqiensis]
MEKGYYRELGKTGIRLSPVGLGCWQFSKGQGAVGKYWDSIEDETMTSIVKTSLEGGINWFDTAEVYGKGASEQALAASLDKLDVPFEDALIATKWWPMLRNADSLVNTIEARKDALNQRPISLYQIHQPFSYSSVRRQMEKMAKLYRDGHIGAVGVSNFSVKKMIEAHDVLAEYDIPLASNQVKYSLLDRSIETNGLLEEARKRSIAIIAYSPLEQGLLTGKFHHDPDRIKLSKGPRKWLGWFKKEGLERSQPLIDVLEHYADQYQVSVSEIVLNWMIHFHQEQFFVIPGASRVEQAEANAHSMNFELHQKELDLISETAWDVLDRKK